MARTLMAAASSARISTLETEADGSSAKRA